MLTYPLTQRLSSAEAPLFHQMIVFMGFRYLYLIDLFLFYSCFIFTLWSVLLLNGVIIFSCGAVCPSSAATQFVPCWRPWRKKKKQGALSSTQSGQIFHWFNENRRTEICRVFIEKRKECRPVIVLSLSVCCSPLLALIFSMHSRKKQEKWSLR